MHGRLSASTLTIPHIQSLRTLHKVDDAGGVLEAGFLCCEVGCDTPPLGLHTHTHTHTHIATAATRRCEHMAHHCTRVGVAAPTWRLAMSVGGTLPSMVTSGSAPT